LTCDHFWPTMLAGTSTTKPFCRPMPEPEPQLDVTIIDFPTEQWTLKELRRRLFAIANQHERRREAKELGWSWLVLANSENRLAQMAFDEAFGRKLDEQYDNEREETREGVSLTYSDLGFSNGEHHGRQLVRNLEAAAAAQARNHLKGPQR
jgi:hypothetical protein